ncbi:hypothetical protein GF407_10715 [candidate division KSB1 bacterium]|nr:hypothetical protein [candidate division KSB1 bacterium]
MDIFNEYAIKAFSLDGKVPEYQLFAGLAFYHTAQFQEAIHLLNGLNAAELSPKYQIFRAAVLADMYRNIDPVKSAHYRKLKAALTTNYKASSYYKTVLQPRIEQLTLK